MIKIPHVEIKVDKKIDEKHYDTVKKLALSIYDSYEKNFKVQTCSNQVNELFETLINGHCACFMLFTDFFDNDLSEYIKIGITFANMNFERNFLSLNINKKMYQSLQEALKGNHEAATKFCQEFNSHNQLMADSKFVKFNEKD